MGDRTICEREEVHYQSLVALYALADPRFRARWRSIDAAYRADDGEVMVTWERYREGEAEAYAGGPRGGRPAYRPEHRAGASQCQPPPFHARSGRYRPPDGCA